MRFPGTLENIGKTIPISLSRRFIIDLLKHSKKVPALPMQRTMSLKPLIDAQSRLNRKLSWCAIFIRAYSLLAERNPELRRTVAYFPRNRFYEHPFNVASFSVERIINNEACVVFGKILAPERCSVGSIDKTVRELKSCPIGEIPQLKSAQRLSRVPNPLRSILWWFALNDGVAKAHFFGTFGISVVASCGAASLTLLSPLTTTVNYGVFQADGALDVRIVYDHRVMDGAFVARRIVELEEILLDEVLSEIEQIEVGQYSTVFDAA
jgi:hypothetical protein